MLHGQPSYLDIHHCHHHENQAELPRQEWFEELAGGLMCSKDHTEDGDG